METVTGSAMNEAFGRLMRAGLLISSRKSLEETLESILEMALDVTGARYGIFRLVDKEGKKLVTKAVAGENLGVPRAEELPIDEHSITGWTAIHRTPLLIDDVKKAPWVDIYYPLYQDLEMRSELTVPLIDASGRLEGVLNLESPNVAAFTEQDKNLLQVLSTQAVIAIQEARLLDALQEITYALLKSPPQEVFRRLITIAGDLLWAEDSAIWTLRGDTLVPQASTFRLGRSEELPVEGSFVGSCITSKNLVISEDIGSDDRFFLPELALERGWAQAMASPLVLNDGSVVGAMSVFGSAESFLARSDWARKVLSMLSHYAALAIDAERTREKLRVAQEQKSLAETFAAVGDIAANLLHRLNNKIGLVPVRIEGIRDKCGDVLSSHPYLESNLDEIERSSAEAMEIVRENLSLLRPVTLAPVDVWDAVTDAIEKLGRPSSVEFEIELEDLPPVIANRQVLAFIFLNLFSNALEAMDGAGKVEIRGRQTSEGWVEISVRDSGPGIPIELQRRIFEPEFSGKRQGKNLGFGLWWVRTMMSRIGGSVRVESDGRHGATFVLLLPAEVEP